MPRSLPRAAILLIALCVLPALGAESTNPVEQPRPSTPSFREVWAYLMRGEESQLTGSEPVSDVCYFSASLSRDGRIAAAVKRPTIVLKDGRMPRVHLVVAELSNDALLHFSLDPRYGVRPLLVQDILEAGRGFDGVQIDFEAVPKEDAGFFRDFLSEIAAGLPPGKMLSVAVPARLKLVQDAYEYSRLAGIADRLIVMAYDEHWSTSAPGPIASLPWCARVADYAMSVVPGRSLVMGLPLYGRAWQEKKLARALRFDNVQDLLAEKNGAPTYASETGASFEYSESVVVKVFYDDERSLAEKLGLYGGRGIRGVSFWRIGQGPPGLWSGIELYDPFDVSDVLGSGAGALLPPVRRPASRAAMEW
jgi:spore germination protein